MQSCTHIPRRQNQKQTETGIEMRDKITGERYEWKIIDQEAELALNGLTIFPNEIKAHQLIKYRTEITQKAPSIVYRQMRAKRSETNVRHAHRNENQIRHGPITRRQRIHHLTGMAGMEGSSKKDENTQKHDTKTTKH
jgi:hypothetical protein